jgi:hypothetical protein
MIVVTLFAFPGLLIWFFVSKRLDKDIGVIKQIIGILAEEIKDANANYGNQK